MKTKRIISALICVVTASTLFTGCSGPVRTEDEAVEKAVEYIKDRHGCSGAWGYVLSGNSVGWIVVVTGSVYRSTEEYVVTVYSEDGKCVEAGNSD